MAAATSDPIVEVVRIGWSLSHPLRVRILVTLLDTGPAAPAEIARRLGAELTATSHHCRALCEAGMLERTHDGTTPPRKAYDVNDRYREHLARLLVDALRAGAQAQ